MELRCPVCKSTMVMTTAEDRWCRKCGFRTTEKKVFEVEKEEK